MWHICVSDSGQHWFRYWLVACSAPNHFEQTSVKFLAKCKFFHSRKCIWKYHLRNVSHFVQVKMSLCSIVITIAYLENQNQLQISAYILSCNYIIILSIQLIMKRDHPFKFMFHQYCNRWMIFFHNMTGISEPVKWSMSLDVPLLLTSTGC